MGNKKQNLDEKYQNPESIWDWLFGGGWGGGGTKG